MTEPVSSSRPESIEKQPPDAVTTEHTLDVGDRTIRYRAIGEWLQLRKLHDPVAEMFHVAYLADKDDQESRPLTFVFNGGPGAASAYLHMGAMGPKRVAFGPTGTLPPPPTDVVDNHESWLAFTDLVFLDPIGTGFSRAIEPEKGNGGQSSSRSDDDGRNDARENPEFWEIERDLDSLGEFIARFLSKHHRWTSPLFIAGESYGGFRVARMARKLQETHGVGLCGALLISPAIEFDSIFGSDYNLTHWIELFPSYVAAALHHGRCRGLPEGASSASARAVGEEFAHGDLARLLSLGERLDEDERRQILNRAADLTGLPGEVWQRAGGRVTATTFCRELLRDQRRMCGRYDASVTAVDPFPDRADYEGPDPSLFSIDRLFTGAINHQLRKNLSIRTELEYRLLSMQVNESWRDDSKGNAFKRLAGAMDDLRYGMSLNEHMRVYVCHGHFDLITPYHSSTRLIELMKLTDAQRQLLTVQNFDGGHMFYSWDESRSAFLASAIDFYASACR